MGFLIFTKTDFEENQARGLDCRRVVPFEHGAGVGVLVDAPHHPAVLQSHALQQPVVHVVADPDGEDAELVLHGRAGVAEDRGRPDLPDRGPPVRQEHHQGDAVRAGVRAGEVLAQQAGAGVDGAVDVGACRKKRPNTADKSNLNRNPMDTNIFCLDLLPLITFRP